MGETKEGEVTREDHQGFPIKTTGPTSTEADNAVTVTAPKPDNKKEEPTK